MVTNAITRVREPRFPHDAEAVRAIWREYVQSPTVDLGFQDYKAEFADLPGKYSPPAGCLLLGEDEAGSILGCGGFRRISNTICEMKRLYVRPRGRGTGLGRRLVERLLTEARQAGYAEMRLDVLAEFEQARKLYADFGFREAEPVTANPVPGTSFLGLRLDR